MLSGRPPFQGNCGKDCDWERGGSCRDCQSMLWHSILDEDFSFPDEEWSMVSLEAKDLISHMLVKEPSKRYTVDSVLSHPWLLMASNNLLKTPAVLSSEVHAHRLSTVTSEAIAYRRIISERQKKEEDYQLITRWSTPPKFGLSPPGNSKLAQRRSLKRLNFSNGHSPDETGKENLKNSIIGGTLQESPDNSLLCRQFEHCLKTRLSDPVLTKAFSETFDEQMNGFLNSSPEEMALSQVKITR